VILPLYISMLNIPYRRSRNTCVNIAKLESLIRRLKRNRWRYYYFIRWLYVLMNILRPVLLNRFFCLIIVLKAFFARQEGCIMGILVVLSRLDFAFYCVMIQLIASRWGRRWINKNITVRFFGDIRLTHLGWSWSTNCFRSRNSKFTCRLAAIVIARPWRLCYSSRIKSIGFAGYHIVWSSLFEVGQSISKLQ
jgi:hypothetical protein